MDANLQEFKDRFIKINSQDTELHLNDGRVWYKSHRSGATGIGKTFEDLLGKVEDNKQLPDFKGIELKAHDEADNGLVTLFTKSPNIPKGVNSLLRNQYGYADSSDGIKVLHTTIPSDKMEFNQKSNHYFQVVNDRDASSVKINVFNDDKSLITDGPNAQWSYSALSKSISNKLHTLAIIETLVHKEGRTTYYSYDKVYITHLTLETILSALNAGDLKIDLRLGAYKSGAKKGKTHDHGTGFRITLKDLKKYVHFDRLI